MEYIIKQGEHYASPRLYSLHFGVSRAEWVVKFLPNCYYTFGEGHIDNKDINKLCGWTNDIFGRNSLRIGWRAVDEERLELIAYVHENGKRVTPPKGTSWSLGKHRFGAKIPISITHTGSTAIFTAANKSVFINYDHCVCWGYWSNIYFGGNQVAPHDMNIKLWKI